MSIHAILVISDKKKNFYLKQEINYKVNNALNLICLFLMLPP